MIKPSDTMWLVYVFKLRIQYEYINMNIYVLI